MRPTLRVALPILALVLPLGGCSIHQAVERFDLESPPPELGRSGWVRSTAGAGAWVGGIAGGVVSLVLLPVTYPIRLIRGEPASNDQDLLFPVSMGAAAGHFILGAPVDLLDYTFHRAWVDDEQDAALESR